MLFTHRDYRVYLREILAKRLQKNRSYSMRAMALQLGVSAGMFSDVLKGQKNLSADKALELSQRLGHSPDEELYFVSLVQLANTTDHERREKILERIQRLSRVEKFHDLSVDHFHAIANWLCAASMALLEEHPKGLKASEIAARFGVTSVEVDDAMERWVRLDLVERTAEGRYRKLLGDHLMMTSAAPDGALRKFHRTLLEKASAALETQSNREKFVGTETISFDPADLPAISEIIEQAVSRILVRARAGKRRTEVYQLGFQFFRLTKQEHQNVRK